MQSLRFVGPLTSCLVIAGLAMFSVAAQGEQASHKGMSGWAQGRGILYTMDNAADGNSILVFARDAAGRLSPVEQATVRTGGKGGADNAAVDPLGSQNSLLYDAGSKMLFAVNAGDNTVSAFDTGAIGVSLQRTDRVASEGMIPVSVAVSARMLYVLNAGGAGAVATFEIDAGGRLSRKSVLELGLTNPTALPFDQSRAPGQVGVDALARRIIVANAAGQELLVAALDDAGIPVGPLTSTATPNPVPFAFDVTRFGNILVAEASGSVSALEPATGNALIVTDTVPIGQLAPCWIVAHPAGFAYVSNTGSNTISLLQFTRSGDLQLLDDVAAESGGAPIDMTLAGHGRFLYALNAGSGEIVGFAIDRQAGSLSRIETQGGLPAGAGIQGIAARDL